MTLAEETKRAAIRELIEKIHALKVTIDEKFQQKAAKESRLNDCTSGYEIYITELRNRRRDLEFQIRRVRNQIMTFQNPQDEGTAADAEPEEQPPLPPEPPDQKGNTLSQTLDNDTLERKQAILHHFARFWHPDLITDRTNPDLMTELNTLFVQSKDEIDMLAAIRWDSAWEMPGKSETLGAQWERMVDWCANLQIAQQRLENQLADVERHSFYPLLAEWESRENKADYFACLAEDERKQIRQLEETLGILQFQFSELATGGKDSG